MKRKNKQERTLKEKGYTYYCSFKLEEYDKAKAFSADLRKKGWKARTVIHTHEYASSIVTVSGRPIYDRYIIIYVIKPAEVSA